MSSLANPIHEKRDSARAFLGGVIETMIRLREEREARMFAFAGAHWRAGTTHVLNLLADELARRYQCTVAVIPTLPLKNSRPGQFPKGFIERSAGVYVAASDAELQTMSDLALEKVWISPKVEDFDFTLTDCPALLTGANALKWTNSADAVFLVVAAGLTHVNQIEEAQRLLEDSSSRLEGIILNRRSYPVPKLLYKLL